MWLCWRASSAEMAEWISGSSCFRGAVFSMCGNATLAQTGAEAKLFRAARGRARPAYRPARTSAGSLCRYATMEGIAATISSRLAS